MDGLKGEERRKEYEEDKDSSHTEKSLEKFFRSPFGMGEKKRGRKVRIILFMVISSSTPLNTLCAL